MRKTRVKLSAEKTEGGLIVPKTITEVKQPFFVKELSKDEFAVVDENGKVERVYTEKLHENPKELAEMYAKKMSDRWLEKK